MNDHTLWSVFRKEAGLNDLLPSDAGEYADDLLDVLKRFPDGWLPTIDCGPGWYKIIADTNRKMRYLVPDYVVHQVKEKFGGLRYHWGAGAEDLDLILSQIMTDIELNAERLSKMRCEQCGGFATTRLDRGRHWFYTKCLECQPHREYDDA